MFVNKFCKCVTYSTILIILLLFLILYAIKIGSIEMSWSRLVSGLFLQYDESVAIIYNLRFPRIIVAVIAGASLSISGLLLQCALRNPLADPGIIGISGGAIFVSTLVTGLFPTLIFVSPLFACLGGLLAFVLIYALSCKSGIVPVRFILVGIALNAFFLGGIKLFSKITNHNIVSVEINRFNQLVWKDVKMLLIYCSVGLIASLVIAPMCNLMRLQEQTITNVGVNVDRLRFVISFIAVFLCSCVTSIIGTMSFLALITPHIARKIVGNDYKKLMIFTVILGSFILLLADTLGRVIFQPIEISSAIIMNIIGGPFFILLLRKSNSA